MVRVVKRNRMFVPVDKDSKRYGKAHGYGRKIDRDGDRYTGEWRNGCYQGRPWATAAANAEECGFR